MLGIMETLISYISENKEWLFSGVGIAILSAIWMALRHWLYRQPGSQSNTNEAPKEIPNSENKNSLEPTTNTNQYIAYVPLNTNITANELMVLNRFCKFPRSQYTQGYRLDWIYNELITDIPESTLHLYLESLFSKGYLAKQRTKQGNIYFRISNDGISYLVDNQLINADSAQQMLQPDRDTAALRSAVSRSG